MNQTGTTGAVSTGRRGARLTESSPGPGMVAEPSSSASTASPDWPLISKLALAPLPTAIGCGRDHARLALTEWGLDHLLDDAVLLVSELLTNALKASWALKVPTPIVLRLLANDRQLLIEAWGQWIEGFDLNRKPYNAEQGRGLMVVAAMSKRWGVGQINEHYKTVWCELSVERP